MSLHDLWTGLVTGLIANVIFAILVAVVAVIIGNHYWRRKVREFFDILPQKGRLPIFLSNIVVKKSGTIGTAPVAQGFYGTAISEVEYFYALQFASTIETRPAYRALRALDPDDIITPVDPLVCEVNISPSMDAMRALGGLDTLHIIRQMVGNRTAVIVGGPIYNTFTLQLMKRLPSRFTFVREDRNGQATRGIKVGPYKQRDDHREFIRRSVGEDHQRQVEYFILEKLTWPIRSDTGSRRKSTKIFLCAGTCSAATAAAVRALTKNWRNLKQLTNGDDFGLLCELYLENAEQREAHPPDDDLQVVFSYGIKPGLL
jgi:hypothetical protein